MPATSPAQERLMQAAAHTPGGYGGVSQKVGREFVGKDAEGTPKEQVLKRFPDAKVVAERGRFVIKSGSRVLGESHGGIGRCWANTASDLRTGVSTQVDAAIAPWRVDYGALDAAVATLARAEGRADAVLKDAAWKGWSQSELRDLMDVERAVDTGTITAAEGDARAARLKKRSVERAAARKDADTDLDHGDLVSAQDVSTDPDDYKYHVTSSIVAMKGHEKTHREAVARMRSFEKSMPGHEGAWQVRENQTYKGRR